MKISHTIHSALLTRRVNVAIVGAGGTGSALLPRLMQLHHAMVELGHPGGLHVTVYDDDTVSKSNIGRQGFFPQDVGQYKASILVNRLNMGWGTDWLGVPIRIGKTHSLTHDIVIGCVDNRKGRVAILDAMRGATHAYYLDAGNSENHGQVVLGEVGYHVIKQHDRLPTVADLFPDAVNPALDSAEDGPSCSMAEALRKQSLVVNTSMATAAFNLLWMLFREGKLSYSGQFINLKSGMSQPIRIDTKTWAELGYFPPPPPPPKPTPDQKAAPKVAAAATATPAPVVQMAAA